jgi:hypothetical protein
MFPLPLILGLIPAIPHIVLGVEKLFGHGSGKTKKQTAMTALTDMLAVVAQASGMPGSDASMEEFLSDVIDSTVKLFNKNGAFSHGGGDATSAT